MMGIILRALSACALTYLMPTLDRHSILIFDELIIENWELDEYKVLEEFCGANYFANEVLAISFPLNRCHSRSLVHEHFKRKYRLRSCKLIIKLFNSLKYSARK